MPNKVEVDVHAVLMKARVTYNHCQVCGRVPKTAMDEPNCTPLRWWDCDDGWRIGTLCRWCAEDALGDRPSPDDYAYAGTNGVCDRDPDTDEDPMLALDG